MKKPLSELIPLLARGIAPSAAMATGLLAPLALGASGDLDPEFADVGRLTPIGDFDGAVWSLEATDDGDILIAGGDFDVSCSYWFYDCEFSGSNFAGQLTDEGSVDSAYNASRPADIEVRDAEMQPDGKMIMVGRKVIDLSSFISSNKLVVYRLAPGGSLDASFGLAGIFELSAADHGNRNTANAVVVDPDGRIVAAGSRGGELIVLRLLADGTLDNSFGDAGVFIGPLHDYDSSTHIVRTSAGGYRVTTSSESQCQILGLTAAGAVDSSFGVAGLAPVATPLGNANQCNSMTSLADDRLLVTGNAGGHGFAASLLGTGAPDPAFTADAVAGGMLDVNAIEVADDDKILVAGSGSEGTMIVRLMADGDPDLSFGNAGTTLIDLPSEYGSQPVIHDLIVRQDGSVLAAGGDDQSDLPFVIRLLGDDGSDGPGVVSVIQPYVEAAEGDQMVVNVRRTGGKTGNVSVAYETISGDWAPAIGGQDYDEVSGRLTWADGDTTAREIVVPVHDDAGAVEEHEQFSIALSDVQGGAGIGTRNAAAVILPDGEPAGQFAVDTFNVTVSEGGLAQIWVYRNYYYDGAVSVTVTPVAGTATAGSDFAADPVTVSWADQDFEAKAVEIGIVNDTDQEGNENFSVELSNPTGGAILGPRTVGSVTIEANDAPLPPPPPPPPNRGGGGGSTGFLSLLLLGLAEFMRSARRSFHRRA
jgi:uncharacterized delta-60 repeat protein